MLNRLSQYLLVLLVAVAVNFFLPRAMPGSPLQFLAGEEVATLTAEQRAAILERAGLNQPLPIQFLRYLAQLVQGNLGYSYQENRPVLDILLERLPWTILLTGTALTLSSLFGVLVGALAAWRRGGALDHTSLAGAIAVDAVPTFWFGMMLVALFAVQWQIFPVFGARTAWANYVGDERQSIYGFAGADADAIGRIVERSQATMLPLPVCYRCPKTHVRLARQIAPEIEWAPDAPEGRVDWIEDRHLAKWLRQGDLVLCRYNAPLVRWCLEMLRQGQRATVRGRELGEEILRIAKAAVRRGRANPAGLATHIEALLAEEIGRIRAQGHDLEMRARLEEARRDLYAAARAVIEDGLQRGLKTYAELERHTLALFDAEQNPIVFSTVHRAKGDEADRVFILHSEAMMAAYAKTPAAVAGEECVQFVALTRARRHLVFVRQAKADEDELPEFSRVVS